MGWVIRLQELLLRVMRSMKASKSLTVTTVQDGETTPVVILSPSTFEYPASVNGICVVDTTITIEGKMIVGEASQEVTYTGTMSMLSGQTGITVVSATSNTITVKIDNGINAAGISRLVYIQGTYEGINYYGSSVLYFQPKPAFSSGYIDSSQLIDPVFINLPDNCNSTEILSWPGTGVNIKVLNLPHAEAFINSPLTVYMFNRGYSVYVNTQTVDNEKEKIMLLDGTYISTNRFVTSGAHKFIIEGRYNSSTGKYYWLLLELIPTYPEGVNDGSGPTPNV